MEINLPGGVQIVSAADALQRMSMLLWGPAGCGKTTLAAPAPGNKLLVNFDPDGPTSLGPRNDVLVLDLSGEKHTVVEKFKVDDPYGLTKILTDEENAIETLIVDSTTAYSQLAVEQGISVTKGATLERPSPGAYGARNAITLRMMTSLLRLTGKIKKNIIFISHESEPTTDDNGNILYITLMLGGKLTNQAALQISEVWHMSDDGKSRKIMLRPGRMRKPMKTRMFDTSANFEYTSKYDQFGKDAPYGEHSLASFLAEYEANGRNKIKVPK